MRDIGDVSESTVMVVVVELGRRAFIWKSQIVGGNVPNILDIVTRNEKIFPAVIVEIEEPGRKAELGFGNTRAGRYFAKFPMARSIRAIIVKEFVETAENGEVEVRPPVVIVIGASDSFDEGFHVEPAGSSAFGEGAIVVVVE